jgi:hypothetical protein
MINIDLNLYQNEVLVNGNAANMSDIEDLVYK